MTAEWFDLGQRLRTATTGRPVPRLAHAPISTTPIPVACRATRSRDQITVTAAAPGHPETTATGYAALDLLARLGVTLAGSDPATLITDDPLTLDNLHRLARTTTTGSELDPVAAHIAWWRERSDFPGGRAVVETTTTCALRWTTGTSPKHETRPDLWRHWLNIPDDSVRGLLDLHQLLIDGPPLHWLDLLAEDDLWSYTAAQNMHTDGYDWRRPDSTSRAAIGLRARCDAADLYTAALLTDPLYRLRAVHTGHVVTGTAHQLDGRLRQVEVSCPRLDSRLRLGNDVIGWSGPPTRRTGPSGQFSATVNAAQVRDGRLILTLGGVSTHRPADADPVTLMPNPPSPSRQRAGRKNYRALYTARRSWLSTGRPPTTSRRPVPLDVLVAGAEPDDPT